MQTRAVWRLVNFLLEGLVFLLIGHQLPAILDDLGGYDLSTIIVAVAVTVAVVLVVRPLWLLLTQSLPRPLRTRLGNVSGSADADDAGDANDANEPDGPAEPDTGRRRNRISERLSGREVLVLSWAAPAGWSASRRFSRFRS